MFVEGGGGVKDRYGDAAQFVFAHHFRSSQTAQGRKRRSEPGGLLGCCLLYAGLRAT